MMTFKGQQCIIYELAMSFHVSTVNIRKVNCLVRLEYHLLSPKKLQILSLSLSLRVVLFISHSYIS